MPPTTDNPTESARDGSDEEWARWEQTFRDARPVLPEAAMARIQTAIRREADPESVMAPSRLRRRIFWLVTALLAINLAAWLGLHFFKRGGGQASVDTPVVSYNVSDSYPLDVPIGPALVAPTRPILPLAENGFEVTPSSSAPIPTSNPASPTPDLLKGAERLVAMSPDGWHALGLLEMRRAANVPAALAAPNPPNVQEFRLGALWRMLEDPTLDRFCDARPRLNLDDLRKGQRFWNETFALLQAWHDHDERAVTNLKLPDLPEEFPSRAAERARFELLMELGVPRAQAALDVLATRSYGPLNPLRGLDGWAAAEPLRNRLRDGYLAGSHDVIERLFALHLLGRSRDEAELLDRAQNLAYLVRRRDLEVLLVRLGPIDAWEKFLRPLMEDEAGFVENPPQFDESRPRTQPAADVQAAAKSERAGTVTYTGSVRISAGPWHITCEKLAVLRSGGHAVLSGSGSVRMTGVMGLLSAAADEMTFNTETGELKLAGRVILEEWSGSRTASACTIIRTGEVRDVER